jgi:hypothetical protein
LVIAHQEPGAREAVGRGSVEETSVESFDRCALRADQVMVVSAESVRHVVAPAAVVEVEARQDADVFQRGEAAVESGAFAAKAHPITDILGCEGAAPVHELLEYGPLQPRKPQAVVVKSVGGVRQVHAPPL